MKVDRQHPPKNSILSIRPYKLGSIWVFDFEPFGLVAEAFVGDVNAQIDQMLDTAGLPAIEQFTALFSANPFPGYHMALHWRKEEHGGNWYYDPYSGREGWLCPVLCLFFGEAPKNIYVRAEP